MPKKQEFLKIALNLKCYLFRSLVSDPDNQRFARPNPEMPKNLSVYVFLNHRKSVAGSVIQAIGTVDLRMAYGKETT